MVTERSRHQARRVAEDGWVVSYLRGRTFTTEQATAAMRTVEELATLQGLAALLGLTPLEAVTLAVNESPWEKGRLGESERRFGWSSAARPLQGAVR
ncbi:hypothetical protein [Nocardia jiangsuensis]|uniref:Uncharacterized protein n=1 Tax=Nocardia jiangsuensis TaxID=1691563 RepID=A0ABV8DU52_9NOCA